MYAVSDVWAAAQNHFLAPEGLISISCYVPELKETLVYTKKDLMSFTHQQTGSLVTGELPKNHIEFSLDNSDGKWNPNNPKGLERYLSERLKITVRYGFVINGVERWIPGGVFYLSEWRTSLNGLEASFVARDVLEYMMNKPYTGAIDGTLYDVAHRAILEAEIPVTGSGSPSLLGEAQLGSVILGDLGEGTAQLSDELKLYSVSDAEYDGSESLAGILQKCAHAAGCVMYQNRNGTLVVDKLSYADTGHIIPTRFSYAYPEIDFTRPLKKVSVTYRDNAVTTYAFGGSGETQTVTNAFIGTKEQADMVAKWVCDNLRSRRWISGELRGDPRLDLFDVVSVESKYGTIAGVVLTDIKYTFTGAFHVAYSGYIRGSGVSVVVYSGEVFSGEVV